MKLRGGLGFVLRAELWLHGPHISMASRIGAASICQGPRKSWRRGERVMLFAVEARIARKCY
jgi:hypothetical protein